METNQIIAEVAQSLTDRIQQSGRSREDIASATGIDSEFLDRPAVLSVAELIALSIELKTTPAALFPEAARLAVTLTGGAR